MRIMKCTHLKWVGVKSCRGTGAQNIPDLQLLCMYLMGISPVQTWKIQPTLIISHDVGLVLLRIL
jgi:hypothetical protein